MCHRLNQKVNLSLSLSFISDDAAAIIEFESDRYPVAPMVIVRGCDAGLEMVTAEFGLVPPWQDPAKIKPSVYARKTFNCRSETAHSLASFRSAFKTRRCLIPAAKFYGPNGNAGNWFSTDEDAMFIAGLGGKWKCGDEPITSCTLLTTEPNDLITENRSGRKRMLVILGSEESQQLWLNPDITEREPLEELFCPFDQKRMVMEPA